jgi:5-formyltetrahydrofolate cyclo-ligase
MKNDGMTKKELRKRFLAERDGLTDREYNILQDLMLIGFQRLSLPPLETVHSYLPMIERKEPNPLPILRWLSFRFPGLRTAAPRADFETISMTHWLIDEKTVFELNDKGIPEPSISIQVQPGEIDLVIIPLLAFDEQGYRVGYGKGFYDRFLAECSPKCLRVGLSFFEAVEKIADTDTFDMAMDYCITPEQVYEF